jgi:hypothetical protein
MKTVYKEAPTVHPIPISSFLMHQDRYKIDRTYQRDEDVWEKWMESYLIDTILKILGSHPILFGIQYA